MSSPEVEALSSPEEGDLDHLRRKSVSSPEEEALSSLGRRLLAHLRTDFLSSPEKEALRYPEEENC